MEQRIIDVRMKYPVTGATKLARIMANDGVQGIPSPSTINSIIKRHGLIKPEDSAASTPYRRFEMAEPNDMWQADYKGHFTLLNGEECHPLNIVDDRSRFCLCSRALDNEKFESFWPIMQELFRQYGLPKYFLSDNGNPWGNGQAQGYSRVDVLMMQYGILPIHGRLHHPQTQGKDESFNHSLTRECLKLKTFSDMADAERGLQEFREFYNNVRPHDALGLGIPSSVYTPSPRQHPGMIMDWEYPKDYRKICIRASGHFKYKGHDYYLGEAFNGEVIGLRKSSREGFMTLEYR